MWFEILIYMHGCSGHKAEGAKGKRGVEIWVKILKDVRAKNWIWSLDSQ